MRKRVDQDATQEVSSSQLVPETKSPYPVISKNDASMWLSQPVSADDFVSQPKKKAPAPRSSNWIVAVSAAVVVAAIGGGVWYAFLREPAKQTSAATTPSKGSAQPAATPDAAVAAAPVADAAVAAAAPAAPTVGTLQVDAVSAADPKVTTKATKRATTKKKVVKKKTATAPKKKRR